MTRQTQSTELDSIVELLADWPAIEFLIRAL